MKKGISNHIKPRIPRGLRVIFPRDINARLKMIQILRDVYELHGFAPLETPALEYVDVLGKYLPQSDQPDSGIFALQDDDEQWIALRYDLTAPLARFFAQHRLDLPTPFRRYQIGTVYRQEKPGPGRFREFFQCDFDTVGTTSPAADAEVCAVLMACFKALGIPENEVIINVNNRKVLTGVLDAIGLPSDDNSPLASTRLTVLRAIDKLDRLGEKGVEELLGKGREDESGDYTKGAMLDNYQINKVMAFIRAGADNRVEVVENLRGLVGNSETGIEGTKELMTIHEHLDSMGLGSEQIAFAPSIVRGLAYYTGPVFEAELTFEIMDKKGKPRRFGSVAGGGRYDGLVERFTGQKVAATGASIGLDRLLAALEAREGSVFKSSGPVIVTVMDKSKLVQYQKMVTELRNAGISAELFFGKGNFGKQVKYADKRNSPVVVIAGEDEFANNKVSIKDLRLGTELSKTIEDHEQWKKQPAQITVDESDLVVQVRKILARYEKRDS